MKVLFLTIALGLVSALRAQDPLFFPVETPDVSLGGREGQVGYVVTVWRGRGQGAVLGLCSKVGSTLRSPRKGSKAAEGCALPSVRAPPRAQGLEGAQGLVT